MTHKKILLIGLFILLLASFVSSNIVNDVFYTNVFDTINEDANLTFVGGDNQTANIELPKYANITSALFNISSESSLNNLSVHLNDEELYSFNFDDFNENVNYFVIIEADSINLAKFQSVSDVAVRQIENDKWVVWSNLSLSDYEINRARLLRLLAYGSGTPSTTSSGGDPFFSSSYVTNVQKIYTNEPRDIGARGIFYNRRIFCTGAGGSGSGTYTFTNTTNNFNISAWSLTASQGGSSTAYLGGDALSNGFDVDKRVNEHNNSATAVLIVGAGGGGNRAYGLLVLITKYSTTDSTPASSCGNDWNEKIDWKDDGGMPEFSAYEESSWGFNITETIDITEQTNEILQLCTEDANDLCNISVLAHSDTAGTLNLNFLNVSLDQYLANFSFYDDETDEDVDPSCTLDGTVFDYTSYTTFEVNKQSNMTCTKFGYTNYDLLDWFLYNESITQNISLTPHHFNIQFVNEITGSLINDANITLELISDSYYINYSTNNGTLYEPFTVPDSYVFRWEADSGYGRIRQYFYTLTNQTETELTLYLLPEASGTETTVTVYDETTLNTVEGAIVYLQRYSIATNTYNTVAMYTTDIAGKSYFDIEHDNELYKFLVDFPYETNKLTSEPLYVSETSINLYISLTDTAGTNFLNELGITYALTYDDSLQQFDLTYNDASVVATQYCFALKKWGQYEQTIVNSSCSTANVGSISLQGLTENLTYYAVFTATIDGKEKVLASSWKTLFQDKLNAGTFGIFMTALIVILFAFVGSFHVYSSILASLGLIFAEFFGIINLGWGAIILLFISSLILSIIIQSKK